MYAATAICGMLIIMDEHIKFQVARACTTIVGFYAVA